MNICPHCQIGFKAFADYSDHIRAQHIKDPLKSKAEPIKLRPMRTSSRSKAQIVHDQEKIWGAAIFPEVKPWHSMEVK